MALTRVLFVCIGNSCRSQMAEGFARKYGADVMESSSAGLAPARSIAQLTSKVMREKNVDIGSHFPKGLEAVSSAPFDLIVNMSGEKVPAPSGVTVEVWKVRDPVSLSEDVFREVANDIEQRVMRLVLLLRASNNRRSGPSHRPD